MVFIAGSNGQRRVLIRTENMGIDWHWRADKLYGTLTGVGGGGGVGSEGEVDHPANKPCKGDNRAKTRQRTFGGFNA